LSPGTIRETKAARSASVRGSDGSSCCRRAVAPLPSATTSVARPSGVASGTFSLRTRTLSPPRRSSRRTATESVSPGATFRLPGAASTSRRRLSSGVEEKRSRMAVTPGSARSLSATALASATTERTAASRARSPEATSS